MLIQHITIFYNSADTINENEETPIRGIRSEGNQGLISTPKNQ